MADIELKPCPFCGDTQRLNYVELSNGLHYIECARCGTAPHRLGAWDRETAVKYWNSVNRWIPCSERLPKEKADVIAVIDGCSREAFYSDSCFIGSNFYRRAEEVTYWMPKPEPPESEVKEYDWD